MRQTITPNPHIPCQPGWCLTYVNEAFGVQKVFPSATSAWFASETKHTGRDFPAGVWTPVWYGLDTTPLGHVVLLAPDGSVYSTSDLTNVPHHHPNLADLEAYYAHYGMTLTYRGWTEDVEGTRVMTAAGSGAIGPQADIITPLPEDDDMFTEKDRAVLNSANIRADMARSEATNAKVAARNSQAAAAQIKGLVGAIAAMAKGEPFDEAKLFAGIQAAAEAGIKAGIKDGAVTVDVTVGGGKQ